MSTRSQDQDLRTALFDIEPDLGAETTEPSIRQIVRGYYAPHFSPEKADDLTTRYLAALRAALPRPVDTERSDVEKEVLFFASYCGPDDAGCSDSRPCDDCLRMSNVFRVNTDGATFVRDFTPAHSPDKAVTREGVYQSTIINLAGSLRIAGEGPLEEMPDAIQSALDGLQRLYALTPKPTGTEAGRGVGAVGEVDAALIHMLQADNIRMRAAGLKLSEAALYVIREYDGTHRLSLAVAEWAKAVADEGGREGRFAAAPTPPVSPTPDSTGPAGVDRTTLARLGGAAFRHADQHHQGHEAYVAADAVIAALTPSAPIAAPVRSYDETSAAPAETRAITLVTVPPSAAQTQDGGR